MEYDRKSGRVAFGQQHYVLVPEMVAECKHIVANEAKAVLALHGVMSETAGGGQ